MNRAGFSQQQNNKFQVERGGALAFIGFTASLGFALSGMANTDHVRHFFDLKRLSNNTWDPSLLFTFIAALGSHFILYQGVIKKGKKPLYGVEYMIPKLTEVDAKLILGAFVFGLGWAVGGFCPGPAITAAFAGQYEATIFACFLFVGYVISYYGQNGFKNITMSTLTSAVAVAVILMFTVNFANKSSGSIWKDSVDNPWAGGAIIGVSAFGLMFFVGRIFGISGLTSGLVVPNPVLIENWMFFIGLVLGSLFVRNFMPKTIMPMDSISMTRVVAAGILVGIGTNLGSGCTSGHGICGISRFSKRSIVATMVFFLTNMFVSTVFL